MGVEYKHYLISEDNTYKPDPEELSRLVGALLEGSFVARGTTNSIREMTPDAGLDCWDSGGVFCHAHVEDRGRLWFPCPCSAQDVEALGEQDFKIIWSVDSSRDSGLKYPLAPFPERGDPYYELELHLATNFVYHCSEGIDPFREVVCECRHILELEHQLPWTVVNPVYFGTRISRICPICGKRFRPQELTATIRDGYTDEQSQRMGGATCIFAIVVDCGKSFAREGWPIRATEEFLGTVSRTLGQDFYEIGDVY